MVTHVQPVTGGPNMYDKLRYVDFEFAPGGIHELISPLALYITWSNAS